MKVIFLDIDGVLNHEDSLKRGTSACKNMTTRDIYLGMLERDKVALVNQIILATGAFVVVSSVWRMGDEADWLETQSMLYEKGLIPESIMDRTPHSWGARRGAEIGVWLEKHEKVVDRFVILDDDSDMGDLMGCLIQTDGFNGGLLQCHVDEAIKRLEAK
jgi:hypothetical protein